MAPLNNTAKSLVLRKQYPRYLPSLSLLHTFSDVYPYHQVLAIEYKKIFSPSPESRPEPSLILNCKYFSNSLVQSCVFLENIAIKEPHEKEEFFKYAFSLSLSLSLSLSSL